MTNNDCRICSKLVTTDEPHLRFSVDFTSTIGNGAVELDRQLVTILHRQCVVETAGQTQYDAIPYIHVAREIVGVQVEKKPERPRHLTVLQGGLAG